MCFSLFGCAATGPLLPMKFETSDAEVLQQPQETKKVVREVPPLWGSDGSTEKNDGTDSRSWSAEWYYSYRRCLEKTPDRKDFILVPI